MNIHQKVAYLYMRKKEAGIFQAPPQLLKDVSSFMTSKYAGHILARVEVKIAEMQGTKQVDYARAFDDTKARFQDAVAFVRSATREGSRDFALRPDLRKAIRIHVEFPGGGSTPYFSYSYVKDNRERRGSTKAARSYKFLGKLQKIWNKELDALHRKREEQKLLGSDQSLVELMRLKNLCLQYTGKARKYKSTARASIEIDLTGWGVVETAMAKVEAKGLDTIRKLRSQQERLANHAADLTEGDSFSFEVPYLVGRGIQVWDRTLGEQTVALRDGMYHMGKMVYEDVVPLQFAIEGLFDEAIERTEQTVEAVTWTEIYKIMEETNFSEITAVLDFKGHKGRGGQWSPGTRELQVDALLEALTVSEFEKVISSIIQVARHECQHVGQDLLKTLKHTKDLVGLPSKSIRDLRYSPGGGGAGRYRREHALQDVEFYTRLADEVGHFIRTVRRLPVDMRSDALRLWVDDVGDRDTGNLKDTLSHYFEDTTFLRGDMPREFFRTLKRREPEKWKKAVKEFVSETQKKLQFS